MGNTLWFEGSKYNTTRVIEKLADIVLERGGRVKYHDDGMEIRTRGFRRHMEKAKRDIERMNMFLSRKSDTFSLEKARIRRKIEEMEDELRRIEREEEEAPVIKSRFMSKYGLCGGCLSFVLNHTYYHFEFADNPFFPDNFQKIRLDENDEYVGQHYMENFAPDGTPEYFLDELWAPCADEETIDYVAEHIFECLMHKAYSGRYKGDYRYINVPNTYNDGYHRERVYDTDNKNGWNTECSEYTWAEAKAQARCYRENACGRFNVRVTKYRENQ